MSFTHISACEPTNTLVELVERGAADIGASWTTITADRLVRTDMTQPYWRLELRFVAHRPSTRLRFFDFLRAFDWPTWLTFACAFPLAGLLLLVVEATAPHGIYRVRAQRAYARRDSPDDERDALLVTAYRWGALWSSASVNVASAALNQPMAKSPRTAAGRGIVLTASAMVITMVALFTATLASLLATSSFVETLDGMSDVL
eukprot:CAMPEP_0198354398 /NCGR_PEP_ID=MMETSP1450-20131203/115179_1 /TAXON_ID=753684 ORGANISM="Madagascaria erythrocladiodes, Strain CCMP3234" /NCGR_SAMPLE_ID=MMETSP1450 /ASSEMBLY_ACC=CAM_ASM_001115 /LENGTH=202 /DNA_ID=CAMNT_0044060659 /DNA_START=17 /DNA_END=622 /DNA_ORIENTATION=+